MKSISVLFCFILFLISSIDNAFPAQIPSFYLDCVVAVGVKTSLTMNGNASYVMMEDSPIQWIGTGFFFGKYVNKIDDRTNKYNVFLVTSKHTLKNQRSIFISLRPKTNAPTKNYEISLFDVSGKANYTEHPQDVIDVVVIPINATLFKEQNVKFRFFQSDLHSLTTEEMIRKGIAEGDSIYVLGYPMGVMLDRQCVISRSGSIARIQDALAKRVNNFIADAFVFPGNSGGPIITKPEPTSIQGTQVINAAYLIGMVSGYIRYQEAAVSLQTHRQRILFEENSGLADVIPMDFILETIEAHCKLRNCPKQ